jgi:hypothetical protein
MFLRVEPHSSLGKPALYIDTAEHPIDDLPCADRLRQGTPFTWEDLLGEFVANDSNPGKNELRTRQAREQRIDKLNTKAGQWICALLNYVQAAVGVTPDERATYQLVDRRFEPFAETLQASVQEMGYRSTSLGELLYIKVYTPEERPLSWTEVWEEFAARYPGQWAVQFFPARRRGPRPGEHLPPVRLAGAASRREHPAARGLTAPRTRRWRQHLAQEIEAISRTATRLTRNWSEDGLPIGLCERTTKEEPMNRKFQKDDIIWLRDFNRRIYSATDPHRPLYAGYFVRHRVVGIVRNSYVIAWAGGSDPLATAVLKEYGFRKAERLFLTTAEKDEEVYRETYKNTLADRVRQADAATLRKVAAVLGYDAPDPQVPVDRA